MPYFSCPHCGHRALKIATRCPHCGHPFESRLWQQPASGSRRRAIPLGLIIVVALVALVVVAVRRGPLGKMAPSADAPDSSPPPVPVAVAPPVESVPPIDSMPSAADSVTAPTPVPSPPLVGRAAGEAELRYASTWVNVRSARSVTAPVIRILNPADTVTVDSLSQGWYRVVTAGQTEGYVDRSLVEPAPPLPRP